ncbi:plasmid partitioning protein RepB [uncultured Roseibium sp.]|uniref:plasmid partitioning protein RepB n=1 Tax=uncultured Roseibium sp. TaxID=1936171 RepID=UPI003217A58A
MTTRKDRLKALFAGDPAEAPVKPQSVARSAPEEGQATPEPTTGQSPRPRAASGAVKAMGLSLGQMADELKKGSGERIAKLDPAKIESSMIADRLTTEALLDEGFEALKESLKTHGQQVPVLVRPHPDETKRADGWYQAAYGHRRIRAARELGLEVAAQIKDLSDEALVLAQGKENSERRDLSFIERAFFARGLIDAGFERATVQDALAVHKTEMTRLLQVAERVPFYIAKAIGPAPKAGRPRWLELGTMLEADAAKEIAGEELHSEAFLTSDSDQRFQRLFSLLARRKVKASQKPKTRQVKSRQGAIIAELKGPALTLGKKVPEPFAAYLADRLPEIWDEYEQNTAKTGRKPG